MTLSRKFISIPKTEPVPIHIGTTERTFFLINTEKSDSGLDISVQTFKRNGSVSEICKLPAGDEAFITATEISIAALDSVSEPVTVEATYLG
ncbi:hypothetical protein E1176_12790 [Fulvivirga sp. RKSG066]|uniref:hypothetical protein n=1 Tax=Fulvivirga aurantia TaxID=2529383 RepID=UPI0012BBF892|nr:hypothetical protein [Fulvivirga aurantia]MTI21902.1 hypothetical protein [Fulvivirga aurantia]